MLLFIALMAAGYYYNLTFVQFGLLDLGKRLIGLREAEIARCMALLAGLTAGIAVGVGLGMSRRNSRCLLRTRLKLIFCAVVAQAVLTRLAPAVRSETGYLGLVAATALVLGVGVPATFGLTVDLVPVRLRGLAGALITGLAYFPAVAVSPDWNIDQFSAGMLWPMLLGAVALAGLAFLPLRFVDRLAGQHSRPDYGPGRFIQVEPGGRLRLRRGLPTLLVLMFGVFFVDSLGFVRLADTPFFFETAWQSPEPGPRIVIGLAHVIAALVAGVLYSALDEKELFLWIFGIFALVHLMSALTARLPLTGTSPLGMPVLYAVAVSLYTVVNFALWADLSTPETIDRNAALGVALSAWTATFLSTALALQMRLSGVDLETHLRLVDSVALLFFLLVGLLIFFSSGRVVRPDPRVMKGEP
jgi:hypothetical protein